MSIQRQKYGELNGKDIYIYTLDNENGLSAQILDYGGIVVKLVFKETDVVWGRDSFEEYLNNDNYCGAIVGRNANRIENAEFELGGKIYKLAKNQGEHNHHGGSVGFDKKIWTAIAFDAEEPSLELSLHSPDGDEGFPGNLDVKVTYTLTKDNALTIHYEGESDADTVLNMTNHCYFNLNGHNSGTIDNHSLWINSGFYTPTTEDGLPTGEILSVKDTPFDFSGDKVLSTHFDTEHSQVAISKGFDHNFALNGFGYRLSARLTGDKTGITMEMYTDCIGLQLYTANFCDSSRIFKDNSTYQIHGALCLESQSFPNALNISHFPSVILEKGKKYDTVTSYKFI